MCDPEIASIIDSAPDDWLDALPSWQASDIRELQTTRSRTLDEILEQLLEVSSARGTVPFGGDSGFQLYKRKIEEEFYYFLCSPNKYQQEREEWKRQANVSKTSAVALISSEFSHVFDAAPPYLGPVVSVMLVTIGTMNLNAFCSMLAARIGEAPSSGQADDKG
jgi:hypothetical protein